MRLDNGAITDSTYLTVADTAALDLTGSFTIEAWANIFSFGDNAQDYRWVPRVCMKPADVTFYDGANWWLEMWGDNRLFHGGYVAESGNVRVGDVAEQHVRAGRVGPPDLHP